MLSVAFALVLAARLCSCIPASGLWRIRRPTLAALAVLAVFATMEAQKRTGGTGTQQGEPEGGDATLPSGVNNMTNTLHFADISVGTNEVVLTLAWPTNFFEAGTTLDLFAATSLVGSAWIWQCAYEVDEGETNWIAAVARESDLRFFCASARADPGDMRDTDGDGIPDLYELHNGTNPYVPDYAAAPKLTVGPSGAFGTIEAAVEASAAYSIVELDPSVSHEVGEQSLGCRIPLHPIMVTAPRPYAVVRSAKLSAFMLATNTTSQTLFRNLYLLLDAKDSFQTGFWCGGNLPMSSVPASATFQNIYVRMPNPGVQYRGWLFYAKCAEKVSILGCTLNAAGATWVTGIDAYDPPPITMDGCSFVNFPPDGADGNSCGILLRTSSLGGGADVALSRTLFDESFIDAWPPGRFVSSNPGSMTASGCILPCQFPMEYPPDVIPNLTVTNAALAWVGVPRPDSPSVALGVGSLAPIVNDPSVDTDGDGLSDYEEAYNRGTDPYLADSDNDGETDWSEIHNGTDPTDPHSFTQALTVTVTNTVSLAHPLYVAWGNSGTGWETNGLASFPGGYGTTNYTNASAQGATYVKAYCDLNGNGEYDADNDILIVREIPYGSTAQVGFVFGDVDGDAVSDAQERSDATDPYDKESYSFDMSVTVTGIFHTTNQLTLAATFGTSTIVGPLLMSTNTWSADFVNLVVTNREKVVLTFWDDANSNGVHEAEETSVNLTLPITNRMNACSYTLSYGAFDADHNGLPDWWELSTGLAVLNEPHSEFDDTDGDGLINLHEYWAGCDPLVPDGSNTLLSVMARSIDDRLIGKSASESIDIFVNYPETGYSHIFDQNTNCWTCGVDLTCCSMWNDGPTLSACGPTQTAVTAISPRHVIYATHYDYLERNHVFQHITTNALLTMPADKIYYFRGRSGQVYGRNIVNRKSVGGDISIGLLNESLPTNDILPACVMPTNFSDYIYDGRCLPVLTVDQQERAIVRSCAGFNIHQVREFISSNLPIGNRQTFNKPVFIGGDSSSPRFFLINNTPVLLGVLHTAGGSGSFVSQYLTKIVAAMNSLLPSSEYQVNILDLSDYATILPCE